MQLILEISNSNDLQLLLEYLRSLPSAKVLGGPVAQDKPKAVKKNFFDRYNGSLKAKQSIQDIDTQLEQMRQEWERPTF
jgi:hypothetical protein